MYMYISLSSCTAICRTFPDESLFKTLPFVFVWCNYHPSHFTHCFTFPSLLRLFYHFKSSGGTIPALILFTFNLIHSSGFTRCHFNVFIISTIFTSPLILLPHVLYRNYNILYYSLCQAYSDWYFSEKIMLCVTSYVKFRIHKSMCIYI